MMQFEQWKSLSFSVFRYLKLMFSKVLKIYLLLFKNLSVIKGFIADKT